MKRSLSLLMVMISLLLVSACFNLDQSNAGVAQINDSNLESLKVETKGDSQLTNEEKATQFVECMRELGFKDLQDPVLNADGSINWGPIKATLGQFKEKDFKLRKAYDTCLPLLQDFTNTKSESAEDLEEHKDKLLEYAKCLREKGLNVPDPDFSDRANMKGFLLDLEDSPKVKRIEEECLKIVWGTTSSGEKK